MLFLYGTQVLQVIQAWLMNCMLGQMIRRTYQPPPTKEYIYILVILILSPELLPLYLKPHVPPHAVSLLIVSLCSLSSCHRYY